ncbi:DUF4345 family protein [Aquipseudomonas ullengensis]|uniref:DUF4345 family protein n=1 Tax=Aquipseudomonas ullengensis TaxID=2759166 RepID=A0A7W4LLH4_9GAMM|nr:DUF4345 family protein [Pseudomonas ullengensis]MBB2495340.1 DUF4345 family protein [Pseudomonas ullengensis]
MLSARILLIVQALILVGFGLAYFIRPQEMANLSGMLLMEPAAITDVRAYYGGLQLGLGLYLVLALVRQEWLRGALALLVLLYASLFVARLGGLWLDGGLQQTFNLSAMLFELVSAGLALFVLRRLDRPD